MREHEDLQKSFETAFDEYLDPIFRYFAYRLSDRERAKELAQETFMRAWLYARKGNTIEAMKPFLYTTASNLYKNELRSRRPSSSLESLIEEYGFEVTDEETPIEEQVEASRLMGKLDQLPERDQEVLRLRYVDGLPPRDIARVLKENDSAVSVRIHRALKKLRAIHEGTP